MSVPCKSLVLSMALLVLASCLAGCGTIAGLGNPDGDSMIYIGVRRDVQFVSGERKTCTGGRYHQHSDCVDLFTWVYILDFPLSLVLDTVILPITILHGLFAPSPNAGKPLEVGK